MIHLTADDTQYKGWFLGPWNSPIPIPVGYAPAHLHERHYHQHTYEVYLVARGQNTAVVNGERVMLRAGQILVVEPSETHTFEDNSEDYLHFVVQAPFAKGDKHNA